MSRSDDQEEAGSGGEEEVAVMSDGTRRASWGVRRLSTNLIRRRFLAPLSATRLLL